MNDGRFCLRKGNRTHYVVAARLPNAQEERLLVVRRNVALERYVS